MVRAAIEFALAMAIQVSHLALRRTRKPQQKIGHVLLGERSQVFGAAVVVDNHFAVCAHASGLRLLRLIARIDERQHEIFFGALITAEEGFHGLTNVALGVLRGGISRHVDRTG